MQEVAKKNGPLSKALSLITTEAIADPASNLLTQRGPSADNCRRYPAALSATVVNGNEAGYSCFWGIGMFETDSGSTPISLLQKLRHPTTRESEQAWQRFVQLYTPLLMLWARRLDLSTEDTADLLQEVFLVLAREMPRFRYDPAHRFRPWLWTVLVNKGRDRYRRIQARPVLAHPKEFEQAMSPDNVQLYADEEYRTYLVGRALEIMRTEMEPVHWQACWQYIVQDRPAAEVAQELGLTVNQVYLAKSRILRRLRTELEGLLD
jgi:RNA polymerase sigma-70 factor (ECF subfamily)